MIFSICMVESDGEGPRSKFKQEDGKTDNEIIWHVRVFVTSVVPPHHHARSREWFKMFMISQNQFAGYLP